MDPISGKSGEEIKVNGQETLQQNAPEFSQMEIFADSPPYMTFRKYINDLRIQHGKEAYYGDMGRTLSEVMQHDMDLVGSKVGEPIVSRSIREQIILDMRTDLVRQGIISREQGTLLTRQDLVDAYRTFEKIRLAESKTTPAEVIAEFRKFSIEPSSSNVNLYSRYFRLMSERRFEETENASVANKDKDKEAQRVPERKVQYGANVIASQDHPQYCSDQVRAFPLLNKGGIVASADGFGSGGPLTDPISFMAMQETETLQKRFIAEGIDIPTLGMAKNYFKERFASITTRLTWYKGLMNADLPMGKMVGRRVVPDISTLTVDDQKIAQLLDEKWIIREQLIEEAKLKLSDGSITDENEKNKLQGKLNELQEVKLENVTATMAVAMRVRDNTGNEGVASFSAGDCGNFIVKGDGTWIRLNEEDNLESWTKSPAAKSNPVLLEYIMNKFPSPKDRLRTMVRDISGAVSGFAYDEPYTTTFKTFDELGIAEGEDFIILTASDGLFDQVVKNEPDGSTSIDTDKLKELTLNTKGSFDLDDEGVVGRLCKDLAQYAWASNIKRDDVGIAAVAMRR